MISVRCNVYGKKDKTVTPSRRLWAKSNMNTLQMGKYTNTVKCERLITNILHVIFSRFQLEGQAYERVWIPCSWKQTTNLLNVSLSTRNLSLRFLSAPFSHQYLWTFFLWPSLKNKNVIKKGKIVSYNSKVFNFLWQPFILIQKPKCH